MTRNEVLERLDVSRETAETLDRYVDLMMKWQTRINLVAAPTLSTVWTRHILDSGQLMRWAPDRPARWTDLGSGAGFPGLVLAVLLQQKLPGSQVILVESNRKKCAFLQEAIRITSAPATVAPMRIKDALASPHLSKSDFVTARALAPLAELLGLASPLLMKGAVGLFLKGEDVEAELTEASKSWKMDVQLHPSLTDPRGRIVCVSALASRTASDGHLS